MQITVELITACAITASTAVGIALWAVYTFQSKTDAQKVEDGITQWIQRLEGEVGTTRVGVEQIKADVSYIRGRLEPRD
jgi:hypothetical protein